MKSADLLKSPFKPLILTLAAVVMGFSLTSCPRQAQPVSQAYYSKTIVGDWQGTVGNVTETMSIKGDGTFVCQVQPMGFISTMLFPKKPGTVRGTWTITGNRITLNITGEKHERLQNSMASSTIISFKKDELVLKSDRGDTSTFQRSRAL
jgi:hypothetical protein